MNKIKIFNDPVYGLVSFPFEFLYDVIEHPYFQRLRRISQTGLTHLVYPGATHTRFHHALGALHLMTKAVRVLREKGTPISDAEAEAVCLAILLHDIGHGPFSHALEGELLEVDHEDISLELMKMLNEAFDGRLDMAIEIFSDKYPRRFLHQLVSSQLDMDRLDYLNRDSFYSGVAEGVIGYDRIISMLQVVDDNIVVEEKGIYSIEKFLIARKIMYWQVYIHKTVLSAEQMLIHFFKRYKKLLLAGEPDVQGLNENIERMLNMQVEGHSMEAYLAQFCLLDDVDVYHLLKKCVTSSDFVLSYLSKGLLHRSLHKVRMQDESIPAAQIAANVAHLQDRLQISEETAKNLIFTGSEKTTTYDENKGKINILLRKGEIVEIDKISHMTQVKNNAIKCYFCSPLPMV